MKKVLIIGDSISMGYAPRVRAMLDGEAEVVRPNANCQDSGFGLANLDAWVGDTKWDVIHFNFGLHDMKYIDETGKYVSPDLGKQVNPLPRYASNLRILIERLNASGAKLIFAVTTPVPKGCPGRVEGAEIAYNETARAIMDEAGIPIDDLHAVVYGKMDRTLGDVHFTGDQYDTLASAVASSVRSALNA